MLTRFLTHDSYARTRSLSAAILCAGLAGCGFGLLMPLVALNLEAMSGSGALVGFNAAAAALSTIVATPLVPILLSRVSARRLMVACAVMIGVGVLAFPFLPIIAIWFVLRFSIGLPVTVIFVASETWINQLAKPESRATLLAVYASVLSAGFGSGGLLLAVLGSEGLAPWIAGAMIYFLGAIPILILKGPGLKPPEPGEAGPKAMLNAARLAPAAILAALVFGALETGIFALFPVYADRIGLTVTQVGMLMAAGALGGITLQVPLGKLADRFGRFRALQGTAIATLITSLLLAYVGGLVWAIGLLVFVFVGLATGFYTIGLALMGERVSATMLASANAAFIFIYGLGALLGPVVAGYAMDIYNPWGLVWAFAGFAGLYLLITLGEKRT